MNLKQGINVLSVFDGMSCGQIALKDMKIQVKKYFAAEIDKASIKQTNHNFPNTIQLGDVRNVDGNNIGWIDLFIGGSPCQGFSFMGKGLNFEDPRSILFFEYVRILKELKKINPDVKFLLENVNMKKEHLRVISESLEIFPVRINSNLVSAQNRDRWYWTNIKTKEVGLFNEIHSDIPQPEDRKIFLNQILEHGVVDRDKSYCIDANYWKGTNVEYYLKKGKRQIAFTTQRTEHGKKLRTEYRKANKKDGFYSPRELTIRKDGKMNCLTASLNKEHTLIDEQLYYRILTPKECSRLQTIPEWYEWVATKNQIYKMCGNGWTIEVIKHIFSFL